MISSRPLPPCPHLPAPPARLDASALSAHGPDRGAGFYLTALTYAHYLWQHGLAARAMLKLDRALLSDLRGDEPALRDWPLPYPAMAWFLRHTPADMCQIFLATCKSDLFFKPLSVKFVSTITMS